MAWGGRGVAGDAGRVADGEAEGVLREGEGREALRARLEVRGGALVALADVPGLALPSLLLLFFSKPVILGIVLTTRK